LLLKNKFKKYTKFNREKKYFSDIMADKEKEEEETEDERKVLANFTNY